MTAGPEHPRPRSAPLRPEPGSDDAVTDLPALDGDDADVDEPDPERLEDDEMLKDEGGDPFDDATGEGDALPDLGGGDEADRGASLLDAGEADGLDIGPPDLLGDEGDRLTDDGREDELAHHDYDLRDDLAASALDGGEEGPSTDDDSLTDEGLPTLGDIDEDDDAVDDPASFFDHDLTRGPSLSREAGRDAWASAWERFGSPLSLPPTRALACAPDGVLAAGREITRVDLEGATERLPGRGLRGGEASGLVLGKVGGKPGLFVTTDTGGLFVSRDAGASFAELPAWRELVRPEEAAAGLDVISTGDGALWGRTAQGSLLTSADGGGRWEKVDVDGFVRALGADDAGRAVVLLRALGQSEVLRQTEGGPVAWSRTSLPGELLAGAMDGHASVVAHGGSVAILIEGDGVLRSIDGGLWSRLAGTSTATALAMLDASGTVVVALPANAPVGAETDAPTALHLARIGADGEPRVVAVWEERSDGAAARDPAEAGEGEPAATAIAVDRAHEVVWVAGGFGVAAFQPRIRTTV